MNRMNKDYLVQLISYDEVSGNFTWINPLSRRVRKGDKAGSKRKDGYIEIRICGELYLAHRLAWFYCHGDWPEFQIDHINGVRDDNSIANLREALNEQNSRNVKMHCDNQSGYKGVFLNKRTGKWVSKIHLNGKSIWVGTFNSPEDAHAAYCEAATKHHDEFARFG